MSKEIAITPPTPYYAVIFTTIRREDMTGYTEMANQMDELVGQQPGFLGFETANADIGITVSYWIDLDSIRQWKENQQHKAAQSKGINNWYSKYQVRIAKVEKEYGFTI